MEMKCHECGSALVQTETTRESGRRYLASRGASGDAAKVKHTAWRCPSCRKVRAVGADREW